MGKLLVVRHRAGRITGIAAAAFVLGAVATFSIVSATVQPAAPAAVDGARPHGRDPIDCWDFDPDGLRDRLFGSDQQSMPNLVSFGGGLVRGGSGDPCDGDVADCSGLDSLADASLELAWNGGKSYFYRIDNAEAYSTWLEGIPDPDLFEACIDSVVREWELDGNAYPTTPPVDDVWSGSEPFVDFSAIGSLLDFLNDYFMDTTLIETYYFSGGGSVILTYGPPPP